MPLMCVQCVKRPAVGAQELCTVCARTPAKKRPFKAHEKPPAATKINFLAIAERMLYPGVGYNELSPGEWARCVQVARTLANQPRRDQRGPSLDKEQVQLIAAYLQEQQILHPARTGIPNGAGPPVAR